MFGDQFKLEVTLAVRLPLIGVDVTPMVPHEGGDGLPVALAGCHPPVVT